MFVVVVPGVDGGVVICGEMAVGGGDGGEGESMPWEVFMCGCVSNIMLWFLRVCVQA